MGEKLRIYVVTYKDFKPVVKSDVYKIVDSRDINFRYRGLDDKFWSEILAYFYVYDTESLPEYIGFCHYRRYFDFLDDIPDMDELFSTHDAIIPDLYVFKETDGTPIDMHLQYSKVHNVDDIDIVHKIIDEEYPEYSDTFNEFLKDNHMYIANSFIMRRKDFIEYINFIKGVIYRYLDIVGDFNEHFSNNREKYQNEYNTAEYNYRVGGYLAERLTTVFIRKRFKNPKEILLKKFLDV